MFPMRIIKLALRVSRQLEACELYDSIAGGGVRFSVCEEIWQE